MAVRDVRFDILADDRTRAAFASVRRNLGDTRRQVSGMTADIAGMGRGLGSLLGVSIGVAGFRQLASAITDTVRSAAGLVDLADKIGITTDALQELRFQADQQGSSAEALDSALEQFSKRIGEAAAGSGELLKILQANGVALRDASGNLRPLTSLLADYADLIKNAANDQDRAVLATQAFGRAHDEMASVLRGGSAELASFAQKAHEANQVIGEEGVRTLQSYDDRLQELKGKWNTAWTEMTVLTLEGLEKIGQAEHFILDPVLDFLNRLPGTIDSAGKAGAAAGRRIAGDDPDQRINQAFDAAGENIPKIVIHPRPLAQTVIPNLGGGGAREKETHAIREQRDAALDLISSLQEELQLVGASDTQRRISNELRQAGASATQTQKDQITALVTQIEAETAAHQALIDKLDGIRDAAAGALSAFDDALANGEGPAKALKAALQDILQTIIKIGEQQAISSLFGAAGTGGGGLLGSLIGAITGRTSSAASAVASVGRSSAASRGGGGSQRVEVIARVDASPLLTATIEHRSMQAEDRASARAPAIARDNSLRFATP